MSVTSSNLTQLINCQIVVILHKLTTLTPLYWSQKVVSNCGSLRTTKNFGGQPEHYNLVVRGTTPFIFLIRTLVGGSKKSFEEKFQTPQKGGQKKFQTRKRGGGRGQKSLNIRRFSKFSLGYTRHPRPHTQKNDHCLK